jgi:hypothetical protein
MNGISVSCCGVTLCSLVDSYKRFKDEDPRGGRIGAKDVAGCLLNVRKDVPDYTTSYFRRSFIAIFPTLSLSGLRICSYRHVVLKKLGSNLG